MRRLVIGVVLIAAGCIDPVDQPVTQEQGAIGEPSNGFPSAAERLGLMAINRARSDPETVAGPSSKSYPARPPVIWSLALNQSSRFHATNLELADVTLMHTSPCTLNTDVATSDCSGDPSCACATPVPASCAMCAKVADINTCGTAIATRLGYFTSGTNITWTGEVAAAGYGDPLAVVNGWMDEAAGSDGHRMNLTDQGITSNTMGYGHATGTKECYSPFDISDSGSIKNATIPKIPTAAVSPAGGAAGTFTFYSTWADPSLGAPASIDVVVDGACTALSRELGTDTLNATYKGTATLAAGCHNYFILARDASGTAVTYPTTGAITLAVGSSTCSSDYLATAPTASCAVDGGMVAGTGGGSATATGGTTGSGTGGAIGTGGRGTGGQTASGAGGASNGTGGASNGSGGAATGGTTGTGTGGATDKVGGCSCDVGANGLPSTTAGLVLLALVYLSRRRIVRAPSWNARRR
jgi:MYXO-CTERM domain-containing protein